MKTRWLIQFLALAAALQSPLAARAELILRASAFDNMSLSDRSSPFHLTANYANGEKNVGLVRFDLPEIGTPIRSATLSIYHLYNPGPESTFGLFRNTAAWTPATVTTWSTLPSHDPIPFATLHLEDSLWGQWRTVDITEMVSLWATEAVPNHGFRLERLDQPNPALFLEGKDYFAPMLAINGGVPEPAAFGLLGALVMIFLVAARHLLRRPVCAPSPKAACGGPH